MLVSLVVSMGLAMQDYVSLCLSLSDVLLNSLSTTVSSTLQTYYMSISEMLARLLSLYQLVLSVFVYLYLDLCVSNYCLQSSALFV